MLRWYCIKAEANKNQPLVTINVAAIHSHDHTTLISKQVHASTG